MNKRSRSLLGRLVSTTGVAVSLATAGLAPLAHAQEPGAESAASPESAVATAPASPESSQDLLVEIVVSDEIEDAAFIRDGLRRETDRQLDIQRVSRHVDAAHPRKIQVEVTGDDFEYQVTTDVERRGKYLRDAKTVNCECSKSDLVTTALREVVAALEELEAAEAAAALPEDPPGPRNDPNPPGDTPTDRPKRLTWLGGVGIGLVVLGAAGLGTGAGLVAVGEIGESGGANEQTDVRPAGYAALGVGAAALIGGVVMIVVDKRRLSKAHQTSLVVPLYDGTTLGLTLSARF